MNSVRSSDGTAIAYDRQGSGPTVILVTGGLDDGSETAPLATELAGHFTAYNYNRRGRGESDDAPPSTVEREIEDIEALIAEAGGAAHLYGVSSGGALALEAAAAGLPIDKVAVYEVPYSVGEDAARRWREYVERLGPTLADGRHGDALELFMRLAGSSDEQIAGAKSSPFWVGGEALAPTLAYEAVVLGDGQPPVDRLARITQPTLVATGGGDEFFEQAANAIAASIPRADRRVVEGQGHVVDPKAFAPVLERFFGPPD
jgi:pimeloyl-ACP methyl ester carboxylesterase